MSVQETFNAVRDSSDKALWSQGVELSRRDAVFGESVTPSEVKLHVLNRATGLAAAVTLFLEDADWSCDCVSEENPCLHVITGIIALKRAREQGQDLPRNKVVRGKITYHFRRAGDSLALHRYLEKADAPMVPFSMNAASIASGRLSAPDLLVTPADVEIERAMVLDENRVVKPHSVSALLAALAKLEKVVIDGQSVQCSEKLYRPTLSVTDEGPLVCVRPSEAAVEIFRNGIVLDGDTLYATSQVQLNSVDSDLLKHGRCFSLKDMPTLSTEILPRLRNHFELMIHTTRLGEIVRVEPHVEIITEQHGEHLHVNARLCYGKPMLAYLDGERLVQLSQDAPVRMREKELFLKDHYSRHFGFSLGEQRRVAGNEAIGLAEAIRTFHGDVVGTSYEAFCLRGDLKPNLQYQVNGGLQLSFTGAGQKVSAKMIFSAWKKGESVLRLPGEGFFSLPAGWLNAHGHALQRFVSFSESAEGNSFLKSVLEEDFAKSFDLLPQPAKDFRGVAARLFDAAPDITTLCDKLNADLRPYQRMGVAWLSRLKSLGCGAILADDMGLGKTLQTIAVMEAGALVVVPTSLMSNWRQEIEKFRPDLSVGIYHGPLRQLPKKDIVITSYAIARLDIDDLCKRTWSMVVIDEAQYIKNPESQTTQAIYKLNAGFRVALSGTPIENRLEDLWSEMHFANPGLLGPRQEFRDLYERPVARGELGYLQQLRSLTSPFVLRRLKSDVAKDLPSRNEIIVKATMSDEQRAFYEATFARAVSDVDQGLEDGKSVVELLEVLLRVRQACCAPSLIPGVTLEDSAKLDCIEGMLTSALGQGHRVLLFSQWTKFLDLIEARIDKHAWRYLRIDGATRDRQHIVDTFQKSPEPLVLLMSLKAGGVGLNLTAADHVIIADPWWNPAAEDQAADRAHRIGQTKPVFIHKIIADDTIEEKIIALQQRKRELALSVLQGSNAGIIAGFGRDEIKELFS